MQDAMQGWGGSMASHRLSSLAGRARRNVENITKDFCEYIGSRRETKKMWTLCQMGQGT